jgi:hypothetical protein
MWAEKHMQNIRLWVCESQWSEPLPIMKWVHWTHWSSSEIGSDFDEGAKYHYSYHYWYHYWYHYHWHSHYHIPRIISKAAESLITIGHFTGAKTTRLVLDADELTFRPLLGTHRYSPLSDIHQTHSPSHSILNSKQQYSLSLTYSLLRWW